MDYALPLRIRLVKPPSGFAFCLQKGKGAKGIRLDYQVSEGHELAFELLVTAREKDGRPDFTGPFAQGTPNARFFYICVGQYTDTEEPFWSGRVKVHLSSIDMSMVEEAAGDESELLEASYQATGANGDPALASVPLSGDGWQIVSR